MVKNNVEIRRPSAADHLLVVTLSVGLALAAPTVFTTSGVLPVSGVVLAGFLLFGPVMTLSAAAGLFLGNAAHFLQTGAPLWSGGNLTANLLALSGGLAGGWAAWAVFGRSDDLGEILSSPRVVTRRFLPAALVYGLLSAAPAAFWYGPSDGGWIQAWPAMAGWAAGSGVGALVTAPFLVTWWVGGIRRRSWGELVPHTAAALALVLLLVAVFGPWTDLVPAFLRQPVFLLVPLAAVALTRGPSTSFLYLALTFLAAESVTQAGFGPFASLETAGPPGGFTALAGVSALVVLYGQSVLASQKKILESRSEDFRQDNLLLENKVEARTRELAETNRRFDSLAMVDSLTKLANRKRFEQVLGRERSRHSRSGKDLSLILLDLDRFRAFNENKGTAEGDSCLKLVGRILAEAAARPADLAARFNGGRFAVLLPETGAAGARTLAEKILADVRALAVPHPGSDVAEVLTASLGVVSGPCRREDTPESLLSLAETQLRRAKAEGRNRVAV